MAIIVIFVTTDMTSRRSKHKNVDDLTKAVRTGLNTNSRTLKVKFFYDEIGNVYI